MASTTDIAFASQETKLVFSGVGTVALEVVSGSPFFLGGAGVDETNGLMIPAAGGPLVVRVSSPDDLYVHHDNTGGTLRLYHNR